MARIRGCPAMALANASSVSWVWENGEPPGTTGVSRPKGRSCTTPRMPTVSKAEVIADIAATKIRDKAIEKAKAFATRIKAGASFDAIAQELGATVQTATGLGRNEASAAFDRVALLSVFSVPQGGVTQALEADGRAARLIQVTAINLAALDPASEAGKNLVAEAGRSLASDLLRLHIDDLKARAGVTVNETLWQQISGSSTP